LLGVDDGQNAGDGLAQIVAVGESFNQYFSSSFCSSVTPISFLIVVFLFRRRASRECSHLVQLAAGRNDLLDAQLAELSLELAELLHQIILALVPKLDGLNFARRLDVWSAFQGPFYYICGMVLPGQHFDGQE
jgi:hypothetical protein